MSAMEQFWRNPSPLPFLYESKPQPARRGRVKDPRGFLQNTLKKDDIEFPSLCYFDVDGIIDGVFLLPKVI
jgi:hypothetical protein